MPKILINEKDRTSPGTPAGYSNYAVLITGFAAKDPVGADSNGVFEFSAADAFKDAIGLVPPKRTKETSAGSIDFYHYGNQMAYELLNMGYSVIYKVINDVDEMTDAKFWEIFKDKASYDFRFVTHGLLESSAITEEAEYAEASATLAAVEAAIEALEEISETVTIESLGELAEGADPEVELANARTTAYIAIKDNYTGFIKSGSTTARYTSYSQAVDGTAARKVELEALMTTLANGALTKETINQINGHIANLAKYTATGALDTNGDATNDMYMKAIPGRGDCIALIEIDENLYTGVSAGETVEERIINAINGMSMIDAANGKYCALTVPSVTYNMTVDSAFEGNKKFPGAFHYLACFMNSLKLGFAEWYAAAGYTRGVSSYAVDHATVKLGEIAINALEPRNYDDPQSDYPKFACNVIANFRGSYYLWGNRTAHPLGKKGNVETGDLVASSFLNIRQLCTTIKKQLYVACRSFTFDPNSDTLWINFKNAILPTLEAMKADQGIRDYKIVKVYTDKKATLKAKIRIVPIEAVEDFDLEVSLEDSFGETAAVVTE